MIRHLAALILFLSLSVPASAKAAEICDGDCEERVKPCAPLRADLQSPNRFLVCGGKDNSVLLKDSKRSPECDKNFRSFLSEVVRVEKKENHCKKAEDCTMTVVDGIPIHLNQSHETRLREDLFKIKKRLQTSCKMGEQFWVNWVAAEDAAYPSYYTCEQKICVPQYNKEKTDWILKLRQRIK
ncbi:MAG: hypothetical protein EOP07_19340 [Proteobacteria bacterium]|nr:MAG: hypothetical protein EOP07_19340 [Pseudomonadota bacterium]